MTYFTVQVSFPSCRNYRRSLLCISRAVEASTPSHLHARETQRPTSCNCPLPGCTHEGNGNKAHCIRTPRERLRRPARQCRPRPTQRWPRAPESRFRLQRPHRVQPARGWWWAQPSQVSGHAHIAAFRRPPDSAPGTRHEEGHGQPRARTPVGPHRILSPCNGSCDGTMCEV